MRLSKADPALHADITTLSRGIVTRRTRGRLLGRCLPAAAGSAASLSGLERTSKWAAVPGRPVKIEDNKWEISCGFVCFYFFKLHSPWRLCATRLRAAKTGVLGSDAWNWHWAAWTVSGTCLVTACGISLNHFGVLSFVAWQQRCSDLT